MAGLSHAADTSLLGINQPTDAYAKTSVELGADQTSLLPTDGEEGAGVRNCRTSGRASALVPTGCGINRLVHVEAPLARVASMFLFGFRRLLHDPCRPR